MKVKIHTGYPIFMLNGLYHVECCNEISWELSRILKRAYDMRMVRGNGN